MHGGKQNSADSKGRRGTGMQRSGAQKRQGRCGLTLLFCLQVMHLVEEIVSPCLCYVNHGTTLKPPQADFGSGISAEALPLLHALAFVLMRDTTGAHVYICSNSWVTKMQPAPFRVRVSAQC